MSWESISIEDACDCLIDYRGKTPKKSDEGIRLLTAKVIKKGRINPEPAEYITETEYERWMTRGIPKKGDVLLTTEAPLGEVAILRTDEKVALAQRTILLRANSEKLDGNFLFYALQTHLVQGRLNSRATGTTVLGIKNKELRRVLIPLPPIEIQKSISIKLLNIDKLIENNLRRIELLEESARLLYKEWFVHLRFPSHEHVKKIDGIPDGWELLTAFDVMQILSGGTPKTKMPEFWDGDIPFFTPKDTTDYAFSYSTQKMITEAGLKKCNSHLYPKYTLFITARGTVGKLSFAQRPMAMNQSCYALLGKDNINQKFLYCALKASIEQFRARASGSVFDAIVVDTFKLIPFIKPTELLINQFTDFVECIFDEVDQLSTMNIKLTEARDILLPRLMNGDLSV